MIDHDHPRRKAPVHNEIAPAWLGLVQQRLQPRQRGVAGGTGSPSRTQQVDDRSLSGATADQREWVER